MSKAEFNPEKLGEQELGWWRAHNEHDREKMVRFLLGYNMGLYGLSEEEAKEAVGYLAAGAGHHDSRDWEGAINEMEKYYDLVKRVSGLVGNPRELAELEVGWWKLHDELEKVSDKTPLAGAFSHLYAVQFGLKDGDLKRAGELKAEATYEHDLAEDPATPPDQIEGHWKKVGELLTDCYRELEKAMVPS